MTSLYHSVPYWLLSRPFYLILSLCTQLTPFKTIWPDFCIVYPIDSFQDHLTLILSLCILFTLFKTIRPHCIIVFPIDPFQDHFIWFYHCVPNWLLSRHMTWILHCVPNWLFKSTWPDFCIVYPIDSFQDHLTILSLCILFTLFKTIHLIVS